MRLIDADSMLKRLEEWNTSDKMDKALYRFTEMRIIEQPTAYDVDKVLEQLERLKDTEQDDSTAEIVSTRIWNKAIQNAISIVKGGGIERQKNNIEKYYF